VAIGSGGTLTVSSSNSSSYAGAISGAGSLAKSGTGTLTLTGSNTYSGGTTISGGTLVGSVASLPGNISNASALGFDDATGGTFSGVISGNGTFEKAGVGNVILSGANTITGSTTVSAGRLSVDGSLASTSVAVQSGAELGGSGSISGSVSIANGGTLAPGNSIDVFATGAASFASGSTFDYEVDSTNLGSLGTAADLLVVDGSVTITSGTVLNFADLNQTPQAFVEDTTIFAMINYTGSLTGTFNYNGTALADGDRFTVGSQMWEIDYNASAGGLNFTNSYQPNSSFVTVTAVPEPSTYVMLAIAGGIAAVAARRRRNA